MKKIIIYGVILILLIYGIYGFSSFGAPSEFGNESTTTCFVGGSKGIVNCTGEGIFSSATASSFSGNNSQWNRSGTDVILSNTDDNVGIGTTTPTSKLHVIGKGSLSEGLTTPNITADDETIEINSNVNLSTNNLTVQYINEWDFTHKTDNGNTRTWVWII